MQVEEELQTTGRAWDAREQLSHAWAVTPAWMNVQLVFKLST